MTDTSKPKPARDASGRLLPGTPTMNPNGRPKKEVVLQDSLRHVDALARASSPMALATVIELMNVGDPRTKLAAALAILDRGIGKAGDKVTEPIQVPDDATQSERAEAITNAALAGDIAVTTANGLLAAMASAAKVRETDELAARISALEGKVKPAPAPAVRNDGWGSKLPNDGWPK